MSEFDLSIMVDLEKRLLDREWRMDNLYYIKDVNGNKIKFVRNESQRTFWKGMWYKNIILKDRQRGFSTLVAIFILDSCPVQFKYRRWHHRHITTRRTEKVR